MDSDLDVIESQQGLKITSEVLGSDINDSDMDINIDEGSLDNFLAPRNSKIIMQFLPPSPPKQKQTISTSTTPNTATTATQDQQSTPPSSSSNRATRNKKRKATEDQEERKDSTLHHTFEVACSLCNRSTPVKDLGNMLLAPTCSNWTLHCSRCTNGQPVVLYSSSASLREVVLRILFALQVHDPKQEFWTPDEIASHIRAHPALAFGADFTDLNPNELRKKVSKCISGDKAVKPHSPGSGRYTYKYPMVDARSKPKPAVISPSIAQKTLIKDRQMTSPSPPLASILNTASRLILDEQNSPVSRSPPSSPTPLPLLPVLPPPSLPLSPTTIEQLGKPTNTEPLADVFVQWQGEDKILGFVRVNLSSPLKELRKTILADWVVKETEDFCFMYQIAPVQIQQEVKMKVRECVSETESRCHVKLKKMSS